MTGLSALRSHIAVGYAVNNALADIGAMAQVSVNSPALELNLSIMVPCVLASRLICVGPHQFRLGKFHNRAIVKQHTGIVFSVPHMQDRRWLV